MRIYLLSKELMLVIISVITLITILDKTYHASIMHYLLSTKLLFTTLNSLTRKKLIIELRDLLLNILWRLMKSLSTLAENEN